MGIGFHIFVKYLKSAYHHWFYDPSHSLAGIQPAVQLAPLSAIKQSEKSGASSAACCEVTLAGLGSGSLSSGSASSGSLPTRGGEPACKTTQSSEHLLKTDSEYEAFSSAPRPR